MAAIRTGLISATQAATSFGDAAPTEFIFKNLGTDKVYIDCGGHTAVKLVGFYLAANEMVTNKDLPQFFKQGPYSAVCDTGETASLYVHFAKPRGT